MRNLVDGTTCGYKNSVINCVGTIHMKNSANYGEFAQNKLWWTATCDVINILP